MQPTPFIIQLELSYVTSYFDVYQNMRIMIFQRFISTNEYSEREAWMLDHWDQISILVTAARGPVHVSAVPLAYDATDVMDYDNLATILSAQVKISIALIGMVRKPSVEHIGLAMSWDIPLRKPRRLYKPQLREGFGLCSTLCCQEDSEKITKIFVILACHIMYSQTHSLPAQYPEGVTDVHKYMPQTLDLLELSQWHPEVKHMRPCHCCLHRLVHHQHVFAAIIRR